MMGRGGAQRVMGNLANYLVNNYEVLLINDFPTPSEIEEYPLDDRIRRVNLRSDIKGNIVLKNVERLFNLRRIIGIERPDVILSFMGRPNIRMLLSTIGLKCKKVASVRNDPYKEYGNGYKKVFAGILFKLADGCVFQTNDAKRYFPNKVQKKSCVIFNPVADVFYETSLAKERKKIVTVGRLEPQKNHILLINAFKNIESDFPDQELYIYGDGVLRGKLEEYIKNKDLETKVHLAGNTNNVPKVLSESIVFVMSSDYEGMPNALMEAMAVGVPCVSTDCPCGGPKMLCRNEKEGILVEVNNEQELTNALTKVLSSKEIQDVMEIEEKKRADEFRPNIILAQWDRYLNTIYER